MVSKRSVRFFTNSTAVNIRLSKCIAQWTESNVTESSTLVLRCQMSVHWIYATTIKQKQMVKNSINWTSKREFTLKLDTHAIMLSKSCENWYIYCLPWSLSEDFSSEMAGWTSEVLLARSGRTIKFPFWIQKLHRSKLRRLIWQC